MSWVLGWHVVEDGATVDFLVNTAVLDAAAAAVRGFSVRGYTCKQRRLFLKSRRL